MNTTIRRLPVEPPLDEAAVRAAAAVYSARLRSLTDQEQARQQVRQDRFDTVGLPRGLYRIERAS